MKLSGRIALVTGGSRGIGAAISMALAEDGADIAIFYRRDAAAAQATVQKIEALGRRARAYCASVDNFDACAVALDAIGHELGPCSILIHNAGIASRGKSVADTDPAEMEWVLRVHAFGPLSCTVAAWGCRAHQDRARLSPSLFRGSDERRLDRRRQ